MAGNDYTKGGPGLPEPGDGPGGETFSYPTYYRNASSSDTMCQVSSDTLYADYASNLGDISNGDYIFLSWNTERDGSGTTLYPGDSLSSLTTPISLYAIWQDNTMAMQTTYGDLYSIAQAIREVNPSLNAEYDPLEYPADFVSGITSIPATMYHYSRPSPGSRNQAYSFLSPKEPVIFIMVLEGGESTSTTNDVVYLYYNKYVDYGYGQTYTNKTIGYRNSSGGVTGVLGSSNVTIAYSDNTFSINLSNYYFADAKYIVLVIR